MSNPTNANCPRCGTVLPATAAEGLCPRCLGALNLLDDTALTGVSPAPAQPPLTPAELAPHFPQLEILECLGRGGMGVVYKARQKTLNRLVALKLLAPERVTDAGFAERFTREAQALARLSHPNIVTIHDFGTTTSPDSQLPAPSFFFLLMEFVDGVNLRQAMKAGRFTPEQALAIVPPVCEALQYAHEHGIVHRDIKPENLLLDKAGRIKIADFGIAKMLHSDSNGDTPVPDALSSFTASAGELGDKSVPATFASVAGTPQYMAPEQKAHRATDHRADIYSLGVVLYELLTGELPADKLQPPSRKVQIDVRLDEIVLRALEKTPELRYQTAAELRTQVETIERADRAKKIEKSNQPPSLSSTLSPLSSPPPPVPNDTAWKVQCRTCGKSRPVAQVPGIQLSASHRERRMFIWCPQCRWPRLAEVIATQLGQADRYERSDKSQPPPSPSSPPPAQLGFFRRSLGWGIFLGALATLALVIGFTMLIGGTALSELLKNSPLFSSKQPLPTAEAKVASTNAPAKGKVAKPVPDISPITSSLVGNDNSPAAIAAAQKQGIATATADIQAGMFRILRYGFLVPSSPNDKDEETGYRIQWVAGSILSNQFRAETDAYNFAMREWFSKNRPAKPDAKAASATRTFPLRHKLGSDMVDQLGSILLSRPGHEAKHSANNQEVIVTAPPDVMQRVQTCIAVTDWPDGMKDFTSIGYLQHTVDRAARSFFYACAIENCGKSMENLLSLHVLAELKGGERTAHYEHYQMGGIPDPAWEKSLRGEWPGKAEALQRLVREWNRYPLKSIRVESGVALGFGVKHFCSVAFEGAPKEFYQVTIEPDRTRPRGSEGAYLFSSLPPWWKDAPAAKSP